MHELMEKISDYHIFNYIIPGACFLILSPLLTDWNYYPANNLFLQLCLCYTIGLIISRIGSFSFYVINKKETKNKSKFAPYEHFIDASQKDPKIIVLNSTANMYRSFSALWLICAFLKFIHIFSDGYKHMPLCFLFLCLSILFICSYKKQTAFVVKRIQKQQNPKRKI